MVRRTWGINTSYLAHMGVVLIQNPTGDFMMKVKRTC